MYIEQRSINKEPWNFGTFDQIISNHWTTIPDNLTHHVSQVYGCHLLFHLLSSPLGIFEDLREFTPVPVELRCLCTSTSLPNQLVSQRCFGISNIPVVKKTNIISIYILYHATIWQVYQDLHGMRFVNLVLSKKGLATWGINDTSSH